MKNLTAKIQVLNSELQFWYQYYNLEFVPKGITLAKFQGEFKLDLPFGFNSAISTENIEFNGKDRNLLVMIYEKYGALAKVDLLIISSTKTIKTRLDFTSCEWDDVNFKVGLKATPLKDKLDEVTKDDLLLNFQSSELKNLMIKNKVLSSVESVGTETTLNVKIEERALATNDKIIVNNSDFNYILKNNIQTFGYVLNMEMRPPEKVEEKSVWNFAENFKSLFSVKLRLNYSSYLQELYNWKLNIKFKSKTQIQSGTTFYLQLVRREQYFRNDGTTDFGERTVLSTKSTTSHYYPTEGFLSFNLQNVENIYTEPNDLTIDEIYRHYYFEVYANYNFSSDVGEVHNLYGTFKLEITDFKLETDIVRINENFTFIPIKKIFEKINQINGTLFNVANLPDNFNNFYISSLEIMRGAKDSIKIKVAELLKAISLLYNVFFIEKNGVYEIAKIDSYIQNAKNNALQILEKDVYNFRYYFKENYTKIKIGQESDKQKIRYYGNTCEVTNYVQEGDQIAEFWDLSNIDIFFNPNKILQNIIYNENQEAPMLFHAVGPNAIVNNLSSNNYVSINEFYTNYRVLRRMGRFIFSNLQKDKKMKGVNVPHYSSFTFGDNGTVNHHSHLLSSGYFKSYFVEFVMKFDFTEIDKFTNLHQAVKIGDKFYYVIKFETNLEPNSVLLTCLEYK